MNSTIVVDKSFARTFDVVRAHMFSDIPVVQNSLVSGVLQDLLTTIIKTDLDEDVNETSRDALAYADISVVSDLYELYYSYRRLYPNVSIESINILDTYGGLHIVF